MAADDYLDGRDPLVKRHHSTLNTPIRVHADGSIDNGIVQYDDLQRSPSPIRGTFAREEDCGVLTICDRSYQHPRPVALIRISEKGVAIAATRHGRQLSEEIDAITDDDDF